MIVNYDEYASQFGYEPTAEEKAENVQAEAEVVYNMLASDYKEQMGITKENIVDKLSKMGDKEVYVTAIYKSEKTSNISAYIISGFLINKKNEQMEEYKMAIALDGSNTTYEIWLPDYVEDKYKDVQEGQDIDIKYSETIEKNMNNVYLIKRIDTPQYVTNLFKQYKDELKYRPDLVYNQLDEEYRKAKFDSLDEFKQYINNRYDDIDSIQTESYASSSQGGKTTYIIITKDGDTYKFTENAAMSCTLELDTYTLDGEEFLDKYNNGTVDEKAMLDINKFMLAINAKDYEYAYSILADSFKKNKFPTQASFEQYAKNNFFARNRFEYSGFESETYYTYDVAIKDATGVNQNSIIKQFIVMLEEGTGFKLSFNV